MITIAARGKLPSRQLYVEHHPCMTAEAAPTLIFLPGGPGGDMKLFKNHQLAQFQQWCHVILMDPRGCGNSEPCDIAEYHRDVYIDDVEAIRQHFGLDKWIVMGASYGSVVAQGYAVCHGQSLSGLVLVNGASSSAFVEDARTNLRQGGTEAQAQMFERLLLGEINTGKALTQYYQVMWPLYTTRHAELAPPVIERDLPAQILTAGFGPGGFLRAFDFTAAFKKVNCPTLIMVGENDWINSPKTVSHAAQAIENSEYHQIPGCGHFPFLDQPDLYYTLCKSWMAKLP